EVTAELLHHDHGRKRAATKSAGAFPEWRSAAPKFGERFPVPAAPAFFARNDLAALVEIVLVAQEALNAGPEQFLFFRQLNIHRIPRAMQSETQNRFRDDVALNFIRSPVNAELSGVQIFLGCRVPIVGSRHEVVGAYRVLTDGQTVIADRLVRQVGDALEYLGAPDLEQRRGRSRVDAARHLSHDTQFGRLQRQDIELNAGNVLDELAERRIVLADFGLHDMLESLQIPGRPADAG